MNLETSYSSRVISVDLLRGVVMLLMALDHVRDYFHYDTFIYDPVDPVASNLPVFFTRFITHYCAPVFMLLAGTSAFFVGRRKNKKELSIWLIKRGLWLILLELTLVKFAWFFTFDIHAFDLMVIWALGVCMILLAGFIHVPKRITLLICFLGVVGHNMLDGVSFETTWAKNLWVLLHQFDMLEIEGLFIFSSYPIIPWVFVMTLGYYLGEFYTDGFNGQQRKRWLLFAGISLTLGFFVIRGLNFYGNLTQWEVYDSWQSTLISFLNVTKYPPSLLYLMITLGPALVFLALTEELNGIVAKNIAVIGRVAMFYYLIHLYVIHLAAAVAAAFSGYGFGSMVLEKWISEVEALKGYGFSLSTTYLVWLVVITILFFICKAYDRYKRSHRHYWWLSYL